MVTAEGLLERSSEASSSPFLQARSVPCSQKASITEVVTSSPPGCRRPAARAFSSAGGSAQPQHRKVGPDKGKCNFPERSALLLRMKKGSAALLWELQRLAPQRSADTAARPPGPGPAPDPQPTARPLTANVVLVRRRPPGLLLPGMSLLLRPRCHPDPCPRAGDAHSGLP